MADERAPGAPQVTATLTAEGTTLTRALDVTAGALQLPPRYRDLGYIAGGGMGEIRRVYDRQLGRVVALKLLRAERSASPGSHARFLREARITAGLQHPGIVPIHETGRFADGRPWFAMKEIDGRTLTAAIAAHHALDAKARATDLRRLMFAFLQICQTIAYAHDNGVVHRDLKPDNLMLGALGEVLVLDWGIALRIGAPAEGEAAGPAPTGDTGDRLTRLGTVMGTPGFMAPEQALGQVDALGPATDIYALGAVLYTLLSGARPYATEPRWQAVLDGPPEPLASSGPPALVSICERAMARAVGERYADAHALIEAVQAWLDGSERAIRAKAIFENAGPVPVEARTLRAEATALRAKAEALAADLQPSDPVEKKAPLWALEDRAGELEQRADREELEWVRQVRSSLDLDADLELAHAALADHYRERLIDAEARRDPADSLRFEAHLRTHDRGRHAAFLTGDGAVTLVTDPPGAQVTCFRYALEQRRLVPRPFADLGRTPLRAVSLPRGSYLLEVTAPGRALTRYPVFIERGTHWDGVRPGSSEPYPIRLLRPAEIAPGHLYVPAGWCIVGGDPEAAESLPRTRVWIDGFTMARDPVTNAEYRDFLNAMVTAGDADLAARLEPRLNGSASDQTAAERVFERDAHGRYALPATERPDFPVVFVDWWSARTCAERAGCQLPTELQWEKAARGCDARFFPWGDHLEPAFTSIFGSQPGDPVRSAVGDKTFDRGPYGHRWLAGNVRTHCADAWVQSPPLHPDDAESIRAAADDLSVARSARGGAWLSVGSMSRPASRFASRSGGRFNVLGFRTVHRLEGSTR